MVLDMATSAIAYFELVDRARRGAPCPPDVGFDAAGRETTDPPPFSTAAPSGPLTGARPTQPNVSGSTSEGAGCRLRKLSTPVQSRVCRCCALHKAAVKSTSRRQRSWLQQCIRMLPAVGPRCMRCRSYKGSHLALVVEMLAGPLVGAAVADKLGTRNWGNLVLAIDPAAVGGDGAAFRRDATALLARVRDTTPLPGSAGPALPGQRSDALAGRHRSDGRGSDGKSIEAIVRFKYFLVGKCAACVSAHVVQGQPSLLC